MIQQSTVANIVEDVPVSSAADADLVGASSTTRETPRRDDDFTENHVLYISSCAVLGSALRVYIGRLFGGDCESKEKIDFFSLLFERICITAGGRTEQTGGALFRDLPANVLGSFAMGILTAKAHSAALAWHDQNHPLQKHKSLHAGLGVGFCGCLTTFASWNSQMVVMLVSFL